MNRNLRTGIMAGVMAVSMGGVAFASVPLYRLFCQVTGFGGTTMRAAESDVPGAVQGKLVNVRFDANTAPALPWSFKPQHAVDRVAIGARDLTFFTARNDSNVPLTGTATFNVTPLQAGQYFSKVQCFCFTEQTLQPGEEMRMPVVFFVDPKIAEDPATKDISEITLSYTFFPVEMPAKAS
jgi:cytochrome c oxidase assembly protein subunit 11